ncbi:zinc finger protein [Fusarium albosuccineum]|uniref:Zinc finger protein n=1 Tax=Fusarium albosuccineum TaxID=1237068 RepID=A0A8H4PEA9_9HYPO|nr:zinc finger protein [Fusarium albosuccineum]
MVTPESGMFQCGSCKKNYKRLDHLARHVRSHTQTKPYKCHVCPKAFTRPDLLKRHVAGHGSQAGDSNESSMGEPRYMPGRVTQACKACASNHLRCSEEKPCRRCEEKGLECRWNSSMDLDVAFTPPQTAQQADDSMFTQSDDSTMMESTGPATNIGQASSSPGMGGQSSLGILTPQTTQNFLQNLDPSLGVDTNPLFFDFPDLNLLSGQWASTGTDAPDMRTYNELDDMDLQFLDAYNTSIPFEVSNTFQPTPRGAQTPHATSHVDPGQPAAMCTEAFQNSHWRFRPNAKDHAGAEEHNLSLPSVTDDYPSPESRVSLDTDTRVTCAKLGGPARDRILMMVVNSCRSDNLSKAVASFPSTELLDTLLQYYLTSPITHATSLLHAASFDPNERRPELVAAMAASGAVLTSDPALSKLGYAIQECLRIAIPKLWEQHNTLVRDLQLSQAFVITLEMGLWSGLPRKVEIAESFFQPILTMMRRDGRFKGSAYLDVTIGEEQGIGLRHEWLKWIEAESFKRLAFRMFSHDMGSSMALLVNPLVSYAEVLLPLPGNPEIWAAATPEQWKSSSVAQGHVEPVYVADLIDDPDVLNNQTNSFDTYVAGLAVLSCTWAMCWEYFQISSLQRSRPRRWNALVTELRKDELLKLLGHLKLSLTSDSSTDPETAMRLEVAFLHMYMPFEDIQIFAGMEGPERARAVYPMIRDWVKSEAARHTIYHAAQIIQIAKSLSKGMIRGPLAIMIYHASLAFWIYGLFSDQSESNMRATNQSVYLDDVESLPLQRFKGFGQGQPCIRWRSEVLGQEDMVMSVPLSQPDKVMEIVMGVVRANFAGMPVSHLTERLLQLMAELENSAKRKVAA